MPKKVKKQYSVNVDMRWSNDYRVTATSKAEAKKKAWAKFSKRLPKKCFDLSVDLL